MKIKIYVDWQRKKILDEKGYKEFKASTINEVADDYFKENCEFSEFLCDQDYSYADIFKMTDEEKEKVKAKWKAQCKESAEETFANDYEYEEIELEV